MEVLFCETNSKNSFLPKLFVPDPPKSNGKSAHRDNGTTNSPFGPSSQRSMELDSIGEVVVNYSDPLGPPAERPKTGVRVAMEDDSDDDLNASELLPM